MRKQDRIDLKQILKERDYPSTVIEVATALLDNLGWVEAEIERCCEVDLSTLDERQKEIIWGAVGVGIAFSRATTAATY